MNAVHGFNIRKYKCFLCELVFKTHTKLHDHRQKFHFDRPPKIGTIRPHDDTVGQVSFGCPMCDKTFTKCNGLKIHIGTVHNRERNFDCDQCSNAFKTKSSLATHQLTHVPASERPKPSQAVLDRRKEYYADRISKPDKKYGVCPICGRSINISGLPGHMRMHTGTNPYKCSYCPKSFTRKPNLTQHLLVHTGTRSFKCDSCAKSFRTASNLREHRVKHGGDKPFKCSYCEKSFFLPFNCRLHERTHTGEKPYKCNLCTEKYTNSSALRRHATVMHPGQETVAVSGSVKPRQYVAERWR